MAAAGSAPRTKVAAGSKPKTNGHATPNQDTDAWDQLPSQLREEGSFVLYRNRGGKKLPYCPANPTKLASLSDPTTWANFDLTRAAFLSYPGFDGINAVCSPEFTFVDLDDCIADGHLSDEAQQIVSGLPDSYWEVSPSGTGLHGLFHSKGGLYVTKSAGSIVEAYSEKHFMSCTGKALDDDTSIGTLQPKHIKLLSAERKATPPTVVNNDGGSIANRGGRHSALLRLAGSLLRNGSTMDAVERAMREHNAAQCHPPLEEKEILRLLRSVAKYKAVGNLLVQEAKDIGNADRLLLFGQGDFRYIAAYKRWAVWDGQRWPVEDREQEDIRTAAHSVVRAYGVQAAEAQEERHMKFSAACGDSSRIAAMIREAQPHAMLRVADMDRDPLLVNFQNGTLDARTGKLREHRREDYITTVIPHNYNPKAEYKKWKTFVRDTFGGDEPLMGFVQRALGYSLTGDTSGKCMLLAHGPKDTAKTTLLATIKTLLGDYAGSIQVESLMMERGRPMDANAQSDLADLRGKRFIMTSETGQGQRLREQLIKLLAQGQGTYRAVRKYENPFEFAETWKIWMDCNHLPVVHGTDAAIWERLLLIPFRQVVDKAKQIPGLGKQLIEQEAEGILAWLVEGLKEWRKQGLHLPSSMQEERTKWREESDDMGQWLHECCVMRNDAATESSRLYESYIDWRKRNGFYEESAVLFARKMKEHGFVKKETGRHKAPTWFGVGLIARQER